MKKRRRTRKRGRSWDKGRLDRLVKNDHFGTEAVFLREWGWTREADGAWWHPEFGRHAEAEAAMLQLRHLRAIEDANRPAGVMERAQHRRIARAR